MQLALYIGLLLIIVHAVNLAPEELTGNLKYSKLDLKSDNL